MSREQTTATKTQLPMCSAELHCWHVYSSMTDGMGQKGFYLERCCWCDLRRKNHWELVPDVKHGPYYHERIQRSGVKYEYGERGAMCEV